MIISDGKLKGMIAVCLILAIVPFVYLSVQSFTKYKIPFYADQFNDCAIVEIDNGGGHSEGIYFVAKGTAVNQLLESVGIEQTSKNNFKLKTGMRLIIPHTTSNQNIVATEMPDVTKLSVGLPLDINKVKEEDLILIKGIGPATARNILALREKLNGFKDIKQLMEIKGIKEKKLMKIQNYLYVENWRK